MIESIAKDKKTNRQDAVLSTAKSAKIIQEKFKPPRRRVEYNVDAEKIEIASFDVSCLFKHYGCSTPSTKGEG